MKDNIVKLLFFVMAACVLIWIALMAAPAWATGGTDIEQETTVDVTTGANTATNDTNVTTGGVSTGGNSSRALALANSLGDVDIAGCLGSTQWSTPLFGRQKLVLNHVCMAEFYLNAGQTKLAAMALCNVPEILKEFSTETACEAAHDFSVLQPDYAGAADMIARAAAEEEEDEKARRELLVQQTRLLETVDTLQEEVQALKSKPRPVIQQTSSNSELLKRLEDDARRRDKAAKILEENN